MSAALFLLKNRVDRLGYFVLRQRLLSESSCSDLNAAIGLEAAAFFLPIE